MTETEITEQELEEWERQLTHRPTDYFGVIHEWMDEGFSQGIFGTSRDADILQQSNWAAVQAMMQPWTNDEDVVRITSSSHWAVGWVETMHVRIRNKKGKFTKAFKQAVEILEKIENYPVLDEWDYSQREFDDMYQYCALEVGEEKAPELQHWLYEEYSVSRSDDIRYEWVVEWKELQSNS